MGEGDRQARTRSADGVAERDCAALIRTVLPEGWVFYEGGVGSGTAKGMGDIKFDHSRGHSSLAYFAFDNDGMACSYEEAKARYGLDKVGSRGSASIGATLSCAITGTWVTVFMVARRRGVGAVVLRSTPSIGTERRFTSGAS